MLALDRLFDAAPRRLRRRVVLRPIRHTVAFESALVTLSREVIRQIDRESRADLEQAARFDLGFIRDAGGIAGGKTALSQALARLRDSAERAIAAIMGRLLNLFDDEGGRFDRRFTASLSASITDPVNLARVLQRSSLDFRMAAAAERHAALIKGLTAEVEKRIAARIGNLMVAGAANGAIADALVAEFGFGLRRAAFIARDQAAAWLGELNRIRQGDAGVTEYVWSTSLDERVRGNPDGRYPNARPSHWNREGQVFRWNDPPSDGHPGYPINCRCVAKAVITF